MADFGQLSTTAEVLKTRISERQFASYWKAAAARSSTGDAAIESIPEMSQCRAAMTDGYRYR
jgi:hypothetical protein